MRGRAKTLPVGELRTVTVETKVEGESESVIDTMTFRVPGLVAIKDAIRLAEEVSSTFGLPSDMAVQVALLGKTYVPDPEEGAINPIAELAEMALIQPEAFMAICTNHSAVMKDCLDWMKVKDEAKNASGESVAPA